jgi:hypothetical protein
MNHDDFDALFERFERSAFRLEARDRYNVPDEQENLAAFLNGQQLPPRTPGNDSWLALVAAATASGRTIERVRIAARPLTDYTRFEFAAYPENIAAGEKIRVLERDLRQDIDRTWAGDDFWIFDDETVVLLHYHEDGRFVRAEQVGNVDAYLFARQRALALSVDFADFPGR